MADHEDVDADKLMELSEKLDRLEGTMRDVTRPYNELVSQLEALKGIAGKYFHLLDLYQRHGVISVDVLMPEVKDPISKEIVRIVMDNPGSNITQITDILRSRAGSASRRIVRARLQELEANGSLEVDDGARSKTYTISEAVRDKWSQVLGLSISDGRSDE